MFIEDALFFISSLIIVALSFFIAEIDPLIQLVFGGYLNFIYGSFIIGNPVFVTLFLFILYRIFGKKYLDFYIQFFVNANLVWVGVLPALYLDTFYDLKLIIMGFCAVYVVLAMFLSGYIRMRLKQIIK